MFYTLYNQINSSSMKSLSRTHKHCNNSSNSNERVLKCMFGYESNQTCDSNNITFYSTTNANIDNTDGVANWQGMCAYLNDQVVICGTAGSTSVTGVGLVYIGNIECDSATQVSYTFKVPGAVSTSCYGARYDFKTNLFTLVGSYNIPDTIVTYGFLFRGSLDELTDASKYITSMHLTHNPVQSTFVHSTDGNFAVGASGQFFRPGTQLQSWIYNITTGTYTSYRFKQSRYTSIYGIILNLNGTYTIVGGCSKGEGNKSSTPIDNAFIADMSYTNDELTIYNETIIDVQSNPITHFEGISRTSHPNIYTVAADSLGITDTQIGMACILQRDAANKRFKLVHSTKVNASCWLQQSGITSCNSILNNTIVGSFSGTGVTPYQCVIDFSKPS